MKNVIVFLGILIISSCSPLYLPNGSGSDGDQIMFESNPDGPAEIAVYQYVTDYCDVHWEVRENIWQTDDREYDFSGLVIRQGSNRYTIFQSPYIWYKEGIKYTLTNLLGQTVVLYLDRVRSSSGAEMLEQQLKDGNCGWLGDGAIKQIYVDGDSIAFVYYNDDTSKLYLPTFATLSQDITLDSTLTDYRLSLSGSTDTVDLPIRRDSFVLNPGNILVQYRNGSEIWRDTFSLSGGGSAFDSIGLLTDTLLGFHGYDTINLRPLTQIGPYLGINQGDGLGGAKWPIYMDQNGAYTTSDLIHAYSNGTLVLDPLSLIVNGGSIFNSDGGDNDLEVKDAGNQPLIFADASTSRVGIGVGSPSYKFQVDGQAFIDSGSDANGLRVGDLGLSRYLHFGYQNIANPYSPSVATTTGIIGVPSGDIWIQDRLAVSGTILATGNITAPNLDTTNWNQAYSWGDHSTEGYLTLETDGSVSNEGALSVGAGNATSAQIISNTLGSSAINIQAGTAISITEAIGIGGSITITNQGDLSATNELQTITLDSISGNYNLSLSDGGGSVKIKRDTDNQTLSIDSNATTYTLDILNGNSVKFAKAGAGGGGTPGGSDTQVQINDGGSFYGEADLTYKKTENKFEVKSGQIAINTYKIYGDSAQGNFFIKNTYTDPSTLPDGSIGIGQNAGGSASGLSLIESVWIGRNAGGNISGATQFQQVSVGFAAGESAQQHATSIGYKSGLVGGIGSTSVGAFSGDASTGTFNTSVGFTSGSASGTHAYNSYLGAYSGYTARGGYNVAVGYSAGGFQDGNYNISIGVNAGVAIKGGSNLDVSSNSIYIGGNTKANNENESNQIVIGHDAEGAGTNTIVLGNSSITDQYLSGNVRASGGYFGNITSVASATGSTAANTFIVNVTYTSTGAVTYTLNTAQVIAGRIIHIKDAGGNAGTNNITIDTQGAELIDGAATKVISTNYGSVQLYSDGSNWFIIN